jgi:hypothetical protein
MTKFLLPLLAVGLVIVTASTLSCASIRTCIQAIFQCAWSRRGKSGGLW